MMDENASGSEERGRQIYRNSGGAAGHLQELIHLNL